MGGEREDRIEKHTQLVKHRKSIHIGSQHGKYINIFMLRNVQIIIEYY